MLIIQMLSFIAFVGVKIAYIYPLKTPPDDNVLGIGLNQPIQLVAPPNSPVCLISIALGSTGFFVIRSSFKTLSDGGC